MERRNRIRFGEGIKEETELYRYLSLSQFMSFVESKKTYLTNINLWQDPWEAALHKLPTMRDDGSLEMPIHSSHENMYGQCWSLNADSDALWRIYSPNREGLMIKSTAKKFLLIKEIMHGLLGRVIYSNFDDSKDFPQGSLEMALVKRKAFEHEIEVRLITVAEMVKGEWNGSPFISLDLNPMEFIEEIVIDPRAEEWFVTTVIDYCKRVGFKIIPFQSKLYSFNPYKSIKFYKQWVAVEKK